MIKPEEIPSLSDDQLFKILKQAGLNKGPITSTTRSLYEKKLIKFLSESKLPELVQNESLLKENKRPTDKVDQVETLRDISSLLSDNQVTENKTKVSSVTKSGSVERSVRAPSEPKTSVNLLTNGSQEKVVKDNVNTNSFSSTSSTVKQPIRTSPPLEMIREKANDLNEPKKTTLNNFEKTGSVERSLRGTTPSSGTSTSASTNSNKSSFPLEFKLINSENDDLNRSKTNPVSTTSPLNEEPILGYLKTDRQQQQQSYLLNRRSIIKLDQNSSLREQTSRFNDVIQPITSSVYEASPSRSSPKVDSSSSSKNRTEQNLAKNNNQSWLMSNLKYLLAVLLVTVIVFYFLQSNEEENPIFND